MSQDESDYSDVLCPHDGAVIQNRGIAMSQRRAQGECPTCGRFYLVATRCGRGLVQMALQEVPELPTT